MATDNPAYDPLKWQIVTDDNGFYCLHETDEDGRPGDLVAELYGDHSALIVSAPRLRSALIALLSIAGTPVTSRQTAVFAEARAALAASIEASRATEVQA